MTNLKARRLMLGLTQQDIGDTVGVSRNLISMIENKKANPSDKVRKELCELLGLKEEELLEEFILKQ